MNTVISHIARRGVEAHAKVHHEYSAIKGDYRMPVWGVALLITTAIVFFVGITMIEYTFGHLIPTLIMIESPQAILFEPIANDDPDATLDSKIEPELLMVKQEPVTSSFRKAIVHLRATGGRLARLRGLGAYLVYGLLFSWLSRWIRIIPFLPSGTAPVFAAVILANLSLTWTHIVISGPSNKHWFRRVPSAKYWKKVAGPTAFVAIAQQLTVLLPAALATFYRLPELNHDNLKKMPCSEKQLAALKAFSVVALGIMMSVFVVLPADVALTRIQASLLSDDQETIVPFDRSFGGKVVPEEDGGSGVIGFMAAWKTFEWSALIRLVKAYVKVFFMEIAFSIFFFFVVIAQIFLIVGEENLRKIAKGRKPSA